MPAQVVITFQQQSSDKAHQLQKDQLSSQRAPHLTSACQTAAAQDFTLDQVNKDLRCKLQIARISRRKLYPLHKLVLQQQ